MSEEEKEGDYFIRNPWAIYPHTFAEYASGGKWKPYRHLRHISIQLAHSIIAGGGRFIVTLPPRHGKSQLISNWLPTWCLHNFPEMRIILASYALEFASKWGSQVKTNLLENPLITTSLSTNTKAKRKFATLEGGQMICAGVGGPITGEGADLFIIDDPLKNYQDAMSPLIRERHKDWFRSVVRTRLEPGATCVILQTRWHEDDLSGWLISGEGKEEADDDVWTVINLPAICEDEADDPIGRKVGEALCPERYALPELKAIEKDLQQMIWSALYQQRPSAMDGNIIQKDWIKFYDEAPTDLDEKAIFADLSFKEGTSTDFSVFECWGRKGANLYLLDQIRGRMGFPAQIASIKEMAMRNPEAYLKQIEEAANGAALIETLKNEIMGLVPWKPMTSKEARLAAVSPMYQAGNVHYPNPDQHPWVQTNIAEILTFPNAKHDDTVDVASMAVFQLGKISSSIQRLEQLGKW